MKLKKINISKGTMAFILSILVVVIFSFPQISDCINEKVPFPYKAFQYYEEIAQPQIGFGIIGILFCLTAVPMMMLYSRFIYKKYGIFITKFNGEYSPELHFKEFISQNIFCRVFGVSSFLVAKGVFVFVIINLGVLFYCILVEK